MLRKKNKKIKQYYYFMDLKCTQNRVMNKITPKKGGDPPPRSRRGTLLRLNSNHRSYPRHSPPYG